jgi:hypothetical protein
MCISIGNDRRPRGPVALLVNLRRFGIHQLSLAIILVVANDNTAVAVPAAAGPIAVNLKLELSLGAYPAQVATATGVAVLSGSGPLGPNVLRLEGAPVNTVVQVPFASFPTVGSRFGFLIPNLGINATLRSGTFAPVTGLQPLTRLRGLHGRFTAPAFGTTYGLDFIRTTRLTTFGPFSVGVGGANLTAVQFSGVPLIGAGASPWTIGAATLSTQTASSPAVFQTMMRSGFLHAPNSSATSVIHYGGALQLVTPTQIYTQWLNASAPTQLALFSTLTITFLPEPEVGLTLCAGALFLVVVGRRRIRRR